MLALPLATNSCIQLEYEAYITIVNIGNLPMTAWVDGAGPKLTPTIPRPGPSPWRMKTRYLDVFLEAEPPAASDFDEITVTLRGDRDVQTWLTGWDCIRSAQQTAEETELPD